MLVVSLVWRPNMMFAFVYLMEMKNREVMDVVVVLLVMAKVVVRYRAVELSVMRVVGKHSEAL